MLALDSPRWSELEHAYGKASDIPRLLSALHDLPNDEERKAEPWHSLWSSLAHQGGVYSASFASVPHVVEALSTAPLEAAAVYFHFPAWVEICRRRTGVSIPFDLKASYDAALGALPDLVARASARDWDDQLLLSALGAIAASKGPPDIAEAVLELTPDAAAEFLHSRLQ